jgi:hypothetical protein
LLEHMRGILDFAAAGAGQIAAEERLEHEDERVTFAAAEALLEDVGGDCPYLGNGNCHDGIFRLSSGFPREKNVPNAEQEREL